MAESIQKTEVTIKDIPVIFDVLTDEEKLFLQKNHTVITYKRNQIIYYEGQRPTGLQCLASGKVKIFKEGVGGRDQIVRLASAPGFIGYRALFAEENHIASAVVMEPCAIIHIKANIINKLLESNNQLCRNIIKSFATELGFSRYRTVSLTQKHVRGRIAESLLILRDTCGYTEDGCTLNVHLSREELANFSNMTSSNAIRTLTNFVTEEAIVVEGRNIKILDEKKLERISQLG
ncbi:MAG: Crp/Fnr family transcriptional regulator [Cytophagaceae bacterium]|nr:Crp/Fnr family transcriptional regulator [Cytophagaceae bacterium]